MTHNVFSKMWKTRPVEQNSAYLKKRKTVGRPPPDSIAKVDECISQNVNAFQTMVGNIYEGSVENFSTSS